MSDRRPDITARDDKRSQSSRRSCLTRMSKFLLLSALVISATALAGDTKPETHVLQSDVKWAQPFGPKGPSFGFVEGKYGDKQPASFFAKMAAGGDSGWHFHNEAYSAVVIEGQFTEQQKGDKAETVLPPGSYLAQPGKIVH